jgi:hypothetical protein
VGCALHLVLGQLTTDALQARDALVTACQQRAQLDTHDTIHRLRDAEKVSHRYQPSSNNPAYVLYGDYCRVL